MLSRYVTATIVGLGMTLALIWLMHFLIEVSEAAVTDPESRTTLNVGRTVIDTPPLVDEPPPEPPISPVEAPPLSPPGSSDGPSNPVTVRTVAATPIVFKDMTAVLDSGNSALINIISAEPEYPIAAGQKSLEGYVVVRFEVTRVGTVENVVVVESSSPLFNKAAIKAAYRSRYKPKTIDGMPQRVEGLQKIFRFKMRT